MKNVKNINLIGYKIVSRSQVRVWVGSVCYSMKIRVGMYGI